MDSGRQYCLYVEHCWRSRLPTTVTHLHRSSNFSDIDGIGFHYGGVLNRPCLLEIGNIVLTYSQVYHIDHAGQDAGTVYCEMQGRENTSGDLMQVANSIK